MKYIEFENGDKYWLVNDRLHRENGPAVENTDGSQFWYLHGRRHREDGPATITSTSKFWWLNDKFFGETKPDNWDELVKLARVEMIMEM